MELTGQFNCNEVQTKTYRVGVTYLTADHPLNNEVTSPSFQDMMLRWVGAYLQTTEPKLAPLVIERMLQAVATLLTGEIKPPATSNFRQLWHNLTTNQELTTADMLAVAYTLLQTVQKQAIVERINQLTMEAIDMCLIYAEAVTDLVITEGVCGQGVHAAAHVAQQLANRSNLGQSVFLTLLTAGKGYAEQLQKLDDLRHFFTTHPEAWLTFLVFGTSNWAKKTLARHWQVSELGVHAWLSGIRRKLDDYLPHVFHIMAPPTTAGSAPAYYPPLTEAQFLTACQDKICLTTEHLALMPPGKATNNMATFLRKLHALADPTNLSFVVTTLFATPLALGAKVLKVRAQLIGQTLPGRASRYYSALEAILSLAASQSPVLVHSPKVDDMLTATQCLSRPFSRCAQQFAQATTTAALRQFYAEHAQPIALVMKPCQVIKRPGNALELTRLFRQYGYIDLEIPKCQVTKIVSSLVHTNFQHHAPKLITVQKPLLCRVYASHKVQQALRQGAEVALLRLLPPRGSTHKVELDLVLTGSVGAFAALAHLSPHPLQQYQDDLVFLVPPQTQLGEDRNRIGPFVQVFDTPTLLSSQVRAMCASYHAVGQQLKLIHRGLSRAQVTHDTSAISKCLTTIHLLYLRRQHLRKEINARCSVEADSHLALSGATTIATEQLTLNPTGTRRGLANAIYNMPDDPAVLTRAIRNLSVMFPDRVFTAVYLSPNGTSLQHVDCPHDPPGHLVRSCANYDYAPCSQCGRWVNTHRNSAQRQRIRLSYERVPRLSTSSSSLGAVTELPSSQ